jgi:hypothetical protein
MHWSVSQLPTSRQSASSMRQSPPRSSQCCYGPQQWPRHYPLISRLGGQPVNRSTQTPDIPFLDWSAEMLDHWIIRSQPEVVILDVFSNKQRFFEGHTNDVQCLVMDPVGETSWRKRQPWMMCHLNLSRSLRILMVFCCLMLKIS